MARKSFDAVRLKELANELFKRLRKEGFIARQNYLCCRTCACAAISVQVESWHKAGRDLSKVKGAVYYTSQDHDNLCDDGYVYLGYGNVEIAVDGKELEVGLSALEVGKRTMELALEVGLAVEWDGSEATRIKLAVPGPDLKARGDE